MASLSFVTPELLKLRYQGIGQKDVTGAATFGNLSPDANAKPRLTVGEVHVANIETDELAEPKAGAEGQGDDQVVARMAGGNLQESLLLGRG